jgi:WD40 repeat protein
VLRTAAQFFHELQAKYQRFGVHSSGESLAEKASMASTTSSEEDDANSTRGPFLEQPICMYHGHSADVLDLSWSKNFFLLSSSMDKTVRLWHISRKECLCCFQHVDFVTAIAFHPRDDRYFLSGSLDGKLRLWNIPDKRVALWNEIEGVGSHLITAANFCMNGKLAVAGTYDGRCIFYETEHLKYHTQIHVKSRHGKNRGRKVSGIEPLPGEEKILVTTNDSRLRLYNLKDHSLSCKYKGGLNTSSQIRATFSRDGLNIVCGSEDHFIYVWKTHHDVNKLSSVRRDRNEFYESFTTHHAPVTAAVFAPVPGITVDQGLKEVGQMVIAADYQGGIKVYVNSENL